MNDEIEDDADVNEVNARMLQKCVEFLHRDKPFSYELALLLDRHVALEARREKEEKREQQIEELKNANAICDRSRAKIANELAYLRSEIDHIKTMYLIDQTQPPLWRRIVDRFQRS
jgi:hypothetical protein